jgi:hypothetical protein
VLASPPLIWIGLISYPLYLWHWPLLAFGAMIKFNPLTLLERELILLLSTALAWATYRFVERPFRFGVPNRSKIFGLGAGMAMIAIAGAAVVWGRGFDSRMPPEIRAMASVATESFKWRVRECLLDLSRDTNFADSCVERDRRPLVLLWGDSTAGALLPGLRKAQEQREFAIAQFTSNSCIPALGADIAGRQCCADGRRAEERDRGPCRRARRRADMAARAAVGSAATFHAPSHADPGALAGQRADRL